MDNSSKLRKHIWNIASVTITKSALRWLLVVMALLDVDSILPIHRPRSIHINILGSRPRVIRDRDIRGGIWYREESIVRIRNG
jgi:hypothetical protein